MATRPEVFVPAAAPAVQARRAGLAQFWHRWGIYYLFMFPFLAVFAVFIIAPVLTAVYLSFTYFNVLEAPRWIGWSNYKLLFLEDDVFVTAIANTLTFAVITGPIGFFLSFFFAWVINPLRFKTVLALCFYAPSIVSGVAMGVVWKIVFSGDRYGYLNNFLLRIGAINEPYLWLSEQATILPVIMLVSLWMSMGTGFLVFLAGLQTVNPELYEAGKVDGISNPLQEVVFITLPMMKPQLLFGAVMAVVAGFSVFEVATSLAGLPSPLYAGHTIVAHLYDFAFIRFEMGYASAVAVILFLWTFGLGRILMRIFSSKNEY
ncbi:MAG TPA: sugar ABC transporter permease [Chloroflexota bacterium]|jgi:multiple sugar transport system permease protein|nr:sugar ABC transporter permease [Chloroflexota bacterium]